MFDATYFRSGLPAHADIAGAGATVELHLLSGHAHRVRSVVEVRDNYVVLEVYQRRGEGAGATAVWHGGANAETPADETQRAVIAYESITQIVVTAAVVGTGARIGFGSR